MVDVITVGTEVMDLMVVGRAVVGRAVVPGTVGNTELGGGGGDGGGGGGVIGLLVWVIGVVGMSV